MYIGTSRKGLLRVEILYRRFVVRIVSNVARYYTSLQVDKLPLGDTRTTHIFRQVTHIRREFRRSYSKNWVNYRIVTKIIVRNIRIDRVLTAFLSF